MQNFYRNKNILITGGAGYIGQLLIEQLIEFNPAVVRILDVHENGLFNLRQKYQQTAGDKVRFLLGDIRNINRLRYALNGVDIVFHTAAYKHVVECEYNPIDAVETNINGTSNVIQAALESNVKKVIFTSSDKAANPSNSMGATKLLAEKLMIAANGYSGTHGTVFACCRFGNVVRSSGSVVPLFEEQIKQGDSITLTDPNMTRFLISNSKAIELVLRSAMLAHGGEVFIFKMPSINIGDLANVMMEKYGTVPKEIIGKKAGEKMYEDLMTEEEKSRAFENEEMYMISPTTADSKYTSYEGYTKVAEINNSRDADRMSKDEILRLIE